MSCLSAIRLSHTLWFDAAESAGRINWTSGDAPLALACRRLTPADIMFGGAPINGVSEAEAIATVHACLKAGIRHFDSAPLYGTSEDKLGAALRSANVASCGAEVTFEGDTGMRVGGEAVYIYTKTGRLIRERVSDAGPHGLAWRPAGSSHQWPRENRMVTDDFSANGAFLSHTESLQRLGGSLRIDTLRIHDADTVGGLGATQATGALDQALLPQGMLAGLVALKHDGAIKNVSLGMNAHRQHRTVAHGESSWTAEVITDFIAAADPGTFDSALLAYGALQLLLAFHRTASLTVNCFSGHSNEWNVCADGLGQVGICCARMRRRFCRPVMTKALRCIWREFSGAASTYSIANIVCHYRH